MRVALLFDLSVCLATVHGKLRNSLYLGKMLVDLIGPAGNRLSHFISGVVLGLFSYHFSEMGVAKAAMRRLD